MSDFVFFGSLIVVAILCLIGLPIAAMVSASRTRRRVEELEKEGRAREKELRWLYDTHKTLEKRIADLERAPFAAAPEAPFTADEPRPTPDEPRPTPIDPRPAENAHDAPAELPPKAEPPPPPKAEPPPPPRPPPPPPPQAFEQRLASWLTKIGAGVALLGVLYFFKYAVDSNLIGATGRVLVGVVAGIGCLGASQKLRDSTQAAFVQILVGLGLAFLFVAVWAASVLYALIPIELGFAANAIVLLIGAALAWHHQGQAILILALIAVFLNPVLLSTGVDRPFALFAYLAAFTGVMIYVAIRQRFGIALIVAVLGVSALFMGWYDRFFDIHDYRQNGLDRPMNELLGAYFPLNARLVPVVFVGIFSAEWLAAAFALKKSEAPRSWTIMMALASLLLLHAGWAALVPDHPAVLGVTMVLAGSIAIMSLHAIGRTDLLMVPMIAAFLILAGRLPDVPNTDQTLVLGILGAWTAVYVLAFLRGASDQHQTITKGAAIRGAIGLGIFTVLAAIMLLDHQRSTAFTLIVGTVTLAIIVLAHRAALAGLGVAALVIAFFLLIAGVDVRDKAVHLDPALLASILAWSAIHVGAVIYALKKKRPVGWLELVTLSSATLGGVLLVFGATPDDVPTLRALIVAAVGITDLMLAAWIARSGENKAWPAILAAQALGLFAISAALALSGATVTVVWALLALITALIWAKDDSPAWAALLVMLVGATVLRLLAVDVEEAHRAMEQFRWTGGRFGVYRLDPFFNARALALVGTGLAFLASAFGLAKNSKRRPFAGALAVLGHILLIALWVTELQGLTLDLPAPPPMILDQAEFQAFWDTVEAAKGAQYSQQAMVTTLTLASAAMVLLTIGFAARDPFHRYLGLAVFVGTVLKLVGYDVWQLARTYQIVVLTVVGALLLGSGFMYARLRSLFTGKTAQVLIAVFATACFARASIAGPDVSAYAEKRSIDGIHAKGDYSIAVDFALYSASKSNGLLDDVRITGPDGSAVPHLARALVLESSYASEEGRMFDPGVRQDGVFQALFELPADTLFCRIDLSVEGPTPYLRRADIETGESAETLRLVTTGALVYAIHGGNGIVTETSVRVPRSRARMVRIALRPDRESADVTRIAGARFIACAPQDAPPSTETVPITIISSTKDEAQRTTVIDLDVGSDGVPLVALDLEIATAELVRRVDVSASAYKNAWPRVTSAYVTRVDDARRPIDSTSIAVPELRKRWIRLTFADGDDAPISVTKVSGRVLRREIILRAASPGPHTLWIGDPQASPASYDLAQIYDRRSNEPPHPPASMGAIAPNPDFGKPKVDPALPLTEQHRGPIGIALAVVLLALAAYAVMLLRKK